MKPIESALSRKRLVVAVATLTALAGALSWFTMDRQEDPFFPYRFGRVTVVFPGADPGRIERQVVEPLEEELAQVQEVIEITSIVRAGVALVQVELNGAIYDTDSAWERVRTAIDKAQQEFPEAVQEPDLDDRLTDNAVVVLGVTGADDLLKLKRAAETLKDRLLGIKGVSRINLVGDPGEQVTVTLDDATARRVGVSPGALGAQLQGRNRITPGGTVRLQGSTATLRPASELRSLDEIRRSPIRLPSGDSVPLASIARVSLGPEEPAQERVWVNGREAVAVELIAKPDETNLVTFGQRIRDRVEELRPQFEPLWVVEMFFQPDRVEKRLDQLGFSLLLGIMIVAGVLILLMDLRLGLVVAAIVPLVSLSSLAVYAAGGGVLHQMSIAGMIVALGMLVDNAIVMVENIQWHVDQGERPAAAAIISVRELAGPLGTATGTTLAAFVPMLLATGGTGDFTRMLPVMIMLTIFVSYLFAVTVTPVMSEYLLKQRKEEYRSWMDSFGERIGSVSIRFAPWVAAGVTVLVGASLFLALFVDNQFFPTANRNQAVIDLRLAEGTHIDTTARAAREMTQALAKQEKVNDVYTFIGSSGPKFYYNLVTTPRVPHRARVVGITDTQDQVPGLTEWAREYAAKNLPQVELVAQPLQQGPPINAPIEIRVFADDTQTLGSVTEQIYEALREVPGARDVRHDLGLGVPSLRYEVDDAVAARYGLNRVDVAQALLGRSRGLEIGSYRGGEDPVPILVRSPEGERYPVDALQSAYVYAPDGSAVPVAQLARVEVEWQPAAIYHREQRRVATVSSQLEQGYAYSEILDAFKPKLAQIEMPRGVDIQYGGEAESAGEANTALFAALPLGLVLLLFFLLLEFNSFRRVGIIMLTVPLAAVGIVPGLLLSDSPFGFTSLLGVIALVGIVVNNAIVLLDVIDHNLKEGRSVEDAIADAVRRRTRPILLTTVTTVAGLLPLAFSGTTLFPPMAWAIISGLIASTLFTLLLVPAVCKWVLSDKDVVRPQTAGGAAAMVLALAIAGAPVPGQAGEAESVSLPEALIMAQQRPQVAAARYRGEAAEHTATAAFRQAWFPSLSANGFAEQTNNPATITTPQGEFQIAEEDQYRAQIELRQPLLNPAQAFYLSPAEKRSAEAEQYNLLRTQQQAAAQAADAYLDVLSVEARLTASQSLLDSLDARLERIQAQADAGRALEADVLRVRLARDQTRQDLLRLNQQQRVARMRLGRALGRNEPIDAQPVGDVDEALALPRIDQAVNTAFERRPDLESLRRRLRANGLQTKAVYAEYAPRLDAVGRHIRSEGTAIASEEETRYGLQLSWTLFASATRGPRRDALNAQLMALEADLEEAQSGILLELEQAYADYETARGLQELGNSGVTSAEESLRVRRARYDAGRATIDDLLEAEADLAEQRASASVADLDVIRAWLSHQLATGAPVEQSARAAAQAAGYEIPAVE